jgi:hypothetical protein
MRSIICAALLALASTTAGAEELVIDDAHIQYNYTYQTLGSQHFCDFATTIAKAPLVIKLTAAFITDDTKPKDRDLTIAYIVEAFVVRPGKNSKLEPQQIKVRAARIISKSFNTDVHASKAAENASVLGASYTIQSEDSIGSFVSVLTALGSYTLTVEREDRPMIISKVEPTPEIFGASEKWNKCSIALMRHQKPPQ